MSKYFRIRGSLVVIKANCLLDAYRKLIGKDLRYWKRHFYTTYSRFSWAEFYTVDGSNGIIDEVKKEDYENQCSLCEHHKW